MAKRPSEEAGPDRYKSASTGVSSEISGKRNFFAELRQPAFVALVCGKQVNRREDYSCNPEFLLSHTHDSRRIHQKMETRCADRTIGGAHAFSRSLQAI